jgi:broad specificity phosphatase PhoE
MYTIKMIKSNFSFYLARHGETELNRLNKCAGGGSDIPLNTNGRLQALSLGKTLTKFNISTVITSPMIRAIETARYAGFNKTQIKDELLEWKIGIFEGEDLEYFLTYRKYSRATDSIIGGESKSEYYERVFCALNDLVDNYSENFLVIAHGGTYWALLEKFNLPYDHLEHCELVKFTMLSNNKIEVSKII